MKNKIFISLIISALFASCGEKQAGRHFISDRAYRQRVHEAFEEKKAIFSAGAQFSIFNDELNPAEREALEFLYAYMPIGDIADYSGEYYLNNIRSSLRAKAEMPWGDSIPELIFRYFVLPIRVNNENLDDSRMVFYEELKDRVRYLSLYDAVLEVNHWCHEKVTYQPSDIRTSAPMASVKTAFGRCGEESTFTVAALRAVGIPARQVYTPRWAHTDDNHAWVEAWVNGRWHFMGACEPEPVLDLGWFNAPASRGLLMHTNVFGDYVGPEEIIRRTACFTEINVIENYAPNAAKTTIKVTDNEGKAIDGALVEFKIYNYAEFFSVAKKYTDNSGQCFLTAGRGDMLVWATKDGKFGFSKVSFGKDADITIVLDKIQGDAATVELDIVPPPENVKLVEVTDVQRTENNRRLAEEDSIRNAYTATFFTATGETAKKYGDAASFLIKSRGNHNEIVKFLNIVPDSLRNSALALLRVISDKDLRDISADKLFDHLNYAQTIPSELTDGSESVEQLFENYVLNPRVANEYHSAYKKFFQDTIDKDMQQAARKDPKILSEWIRKQIAVRNDLNPLDIPVMPQGVYSARLADEQSRNILFVALARSIGIPARIEQVTGKLQYFNRGWQDIYIDGENQATTKKGFLEVSFRPTKAVDNPKYYSHFSIARIQPDATLRTLDFENHAGGDTWKDLFKTPMPLDEGNYVLVSGTRMASGKVLAHMQFFAVSPDKTTGINLVMRDDANDIQVLGNIDAEAKFITTSDNQEVSILATTGRGYFVIGILGVGQEPTIHALNDIAGQKSSFEQWNRSIILLFKDEASNKQFDKTDFGALPSTVTFGIDRDGAILDMIAKAMKINDKTRLPIFVIADTFGRVVFISQGYTIGLGGQIYQVIRKL
ncbi:MAG: transglutaminase-like domain-containing protein [Tannerella sp.]|jgi:transglutaminase-like putative cysteine protease|nr:transglutaminase-like domain-containing protein [Tannerella sp.]